MMSCRRWPVSCVVAVLLAGVWGCGSSEPKVELGTVTGTVTLDGAKVTGGRVIFFNVSGSSATADISADGTYSVETALGETEVFINHREPDITPPEGRAGMPMPGKSLVPDKYADSKSSGLKLTVQSGENTLDIPMVSK